MNKLIKEFKDKEVVDCDYMRLRRKVDARKSYSQLETIFNVRIDNAYNKVYDQSGLYILSFIDKKHLIQQLKEI